MKTDMNVVYEEILQSEGFVVNNYTVVSHGNDLYSVVNRNNGKILITKAKDEYKALEGVIIGG